MLALMMEDSGGTYIIQPVTDCGDTFEGWYRDTRVGIKKDDTRILYLYDDITDEILWEPVQKVKGKKAKVYNFTPWEEDIES